MAIMKHPSKAGRPIEFSQEDHKRIVAAYKETIVLSNVAGRVRRDKDTISGWLSRGQDDHKMQLDTELARFFLDVKEALAETIISLEKKLMKSVKGWQRFAWILERCARKDYSQNGELLQKIEEALAGLHNKNADGSSIDLVKADILAQVKKLQSRDGQAIEQSNSKTD